MVTFAGPGRVGLYYTPHLCDDAFRSIPLGMKTIWTSRLRRILPAILLALALAGRANAADSLAWHLQQDRVDADIRTWDVPALLDKVAAATGWQIYFDPGASHAVSAKFASLPAGEALRALLGNVNFLIVPQPNGPTRLYVFRTSQSQATRLIVAHKAAQPIPNQLVVTLKPGSKVNIDDLAKSLGAKVIGRMDGQNAYLPQFDDTAAAQAGRQSLEANPDVASVDYNYPVDRPPVPDMAQASGPDLQLKPKSNDGNCQLIIGLIDTPVQSLSGNLNSFLKPAISITGTKQVPALPLTHGTAMAETMLRALQVKTGGNTSVQIQPVDVYGNSEMTSTFDVANGIVQAVNNGANIINLSLGSTGDSQVLHNVINQVTQEGIPVYAAAGNEPVTTPTYPAAYPGVIAVTASDSSGNIASYANRGSFVKMIAPGDNVVNYDGNNYLVEGTSTSTAIISGSAAAAADNAHACADQAQALLQKATTTVTALKP